MTSTRFRMVSLPAAVGALIVTIIMRTSRFFHRYAARAFLVTVAIGGALLISGVANAAPPANTPAVTVATAVPTATTTTLITSPVSPVTQGTMVTLTAAVMPETAAGTVQFKDGTTNIGNPQPVTNGTASGTISTLAVGSHQLTAVFNPTEPTAFSSSMSPPVTFVVNAPAGSTANGSTANGSTAAAATATRTTLTTDPASTVARGAPVTLTATITPATAAGTIQFREGTTNIGDPVTVTNGTASTTTSTLAVGSRRLTAEFTPTEPTAFSRSTSEAVTLTVTESTPPQAQRSAQSLDGLIVIDLDGRERSAPSDGSRADNNLDGLIVVDLGDLGSVLDLDGNDRGQTSNVRDNDDEGLLDGLISVVLD